MLQACPPRTVHSRGRSSEPGELSRVCGCLHLCAWCGQSDSVARLQGAAEHSALMERPWTLTGCHLRVGSGLSLLGRDGRVVSVVLTAGMLRDAAALIPGLHIPAQLGQHLDVQLLQPVSYGRK